MFRKCVDISVCDLEPKSTRIVMCISWHFVPHSVSVVDDGARAVPFLIPDEAPVNARVRLARQAANLRPEAVAAALGMSLRSYYRAEAGDRTLSRADLVMIAMLTDQHPSLFGVSD